MRRLFFFSSRRRHTRFDCDWSSDVCSSDLGPGCSNSRGCSYSLDRGSLPGGPDSFHLSDNTPFTGDVSNSNEQMHLQTPIKRDSIFVDARVDLNDQVRFNTQLAYNRRTTTSQ